MVSKPKKVVLTAGFLLLSLGGTLFAAFPAESVYAAAPGIYPFGGPVIATFICPCTGSLIFTVGPPKPGMFITQPATWIFRNFKIIPSSYVLGTAATAPMPCLVPIPTPVGVPICIPFLFGMPVIMIGTS